MWLLFNVLLQDVLILKATAQVRVTKLPRLHISLSCAFYPFSLVSFISLASKAGIPPQPLPMTGPKTKETSFSTLFFWKLMGSYWLVLTRRSQTLDSLYSERYERSTLCRCHHKGSTLRLFHWNNCSVTVNLSVRSWFEPMISSTSV